MGHRTVYQAMRTTEVKTVAADVSPLRIHPFLSPLQLLPWHPPSSDVAVPGEE